MKRLIAFLLSLFHCGNLTTVYDNPLSFLPVYPDGAIVRELGADGRWERQAGHKVPVLKGIKGQWYGYTPENDWLHSFGWPNDYEAFRQTVLYKGDKIVGELWWYRFYSKPDLTVLFVYENMDHNPDAMGEHDGHHSFVWWGEIVE